MSIQIKIYSQFFASLILSVTLAQCNPTQSKEEVLSIAYIYENCSSCHSLVSTPNSIAPSIGEIKQAYTNNAKNEEEFLAKLNLYIKEPSAENSVQADWVAKYGIMPKMGFSEKRLKSSLVYLYQKDWGSKEWTERNQKWLADPKSLSKQLLSDMTPLEHAQGAAMKTKSALGSQLMKAIKERGTEGAIQFCNTAAIPLTQKMSQDLKMDISRVSDRARNPNNQASESEKKIIEEYKIDVSKGNKLSPTVVEEVSQIISYFPVETNAMCLQCHGVLEKDIKQNIHESISKLYPKDEAVGYSSGDIRGLFKVIQSK